MKRLLFSFTCLLIATTAIAQWHEIKSPTEQPQQKTETKKTESKSQKSSKTSSSKSSKTSSAPLCPDGKHPHMIDLGLPSGTKWACCNVGADKPEAYGGYYARRKQKALMTGKHTSIATVLKKPVTTSAATSPAQNTMWRM